MPMAASSPDDETPAKFAALLDLPADELSYLNQLPAGAASELADKVEHAIEERRHVILQALDDAGKFLPGPLRRKLAQRIQGD